MVRGEAHDHSTNPLQRRIRVRVVRVRRFWNYAQGNDAGYGPLRSVLLCNVSRRSSDRWLGDVAGEEIAASSELRLP